MQLRRDNDGCIRDYMALHLRYSSANGVGSGIMVSKGCAMTDNPNYNLVDIVVWIMWTAFIAGASYYVGNYMGFQAGYVAGWNECINSFGGLLP